MKTVPSGVLVRLFRLIGNNIDATAKAITIAPRHPPQPVRVSAAMRSRRARGGLSEPATERATVIARDHLLHLLGNLAW
jgi:hypothetical protein